MVDQRLFMRNSMKNQISIVLGSQSHDEILYCADTPIDSCGYFEGEDPCDCSVVTYGESDHEEESEDEQADDTFGGSFDLFFSDWIPSFVLEWQTSPSIPVMQISAISSNRLDEPENDDDADEDNQKEMQSLL